MKPHHFIKVCRKCGERKRVIATCDWETLRELYVCICGAEAPDVSIFPWSYYWKEQTGREKS
ncbi:MAG: hypothetical protein DRP47_09320 [Candidatus Zixiibacteriota bacterium]|nr:MAG: hypothetical protein DRP47_09320 [candidate division Zixibacteria bacterium]